MKHNNDRSAINTNMTLKHLSRTYIHLTTVELHSVQDGKNTTKLSNTLDELHTNAKAKIPITIIKEIILVPH